MLSRKSFSLLENTKKVCFKLASPFRRYLAESREQKTINRNIELEFLLTYEANLRKLRDATKSRIGFNGDEYLRDELRDIERSLANIPGRRRDVLNW